jgi:O-Antigen ligase
MAGPPRLHAFHAERSPVPALAAAAAVAATAAVTLYAERRVGAPGLLVPVGIAAILVVLGRPLVAISAVLVLVVVCEGPTFGIGVTPDLYKQVFKGLTPLDMLVAIAFTAVLLDLLRRRRQPRLPRTLAVPLTLVALAIVSGIVVGHSHGVGTREVIFSVHVLVYLLVLPLTIFNLDLDEPLLRRAIEIALALAFVKAVAGLVVMAAGLSTELQTGTGITYYEPTANWLIMVAFLGIAAAWLGGVRPPRWLLLATPVLIASLLLSYRRSFWIAVVLSFLLVLVAVSTPRKRVLLLSVGLLMTAAILTLGSLQFQSQSPVLERIQSLSPTKIQANAEDRYRLDERANVIAAIEHSPIAGLGMDVDWSASARPLGVEHENGRQYVHFALLWWWLKLGILGAIAYLAVVISGLILAWRTWRGHQQPMLRYFGLASLCALGGLVVIETTASFTGVDARFTVLLGAQLGLLAVLAQGAARPGPASS